MKVNIIVPQKAVIDANILMFLFKKIKHKIEPKMIPSESYKCDKASINIFIGVINPILIPMAKTNILLFDSMLFPKSQLYTLRNMDYVLTKTEYEKTVVVDSYPKDRIINLGWRSSDINMSSISPDYSKYLLFCYDNNTDYKSIIDTWSECKDELGGGKTLHIVNFGLTRLTEDYVKNKSIVIEKNLEQNRFENLFNECGIHICCPNLDTFSHYLNQTMLSRCIPIISDLPCLTENVNLDYCFLVQGTKIKSKTHLGKKLALNMNDLKRAFIDSSKLSDEVLENLGRQARLDGLKYHSKNDHMFKEHFGRICKETLEKSIPKIKLEFDDKVKTEDYPTVSIVTLTHNRKKFFRLAVFNYNTIDYPKDKLEWIIYDTSDKENCVEDMLPVEEARSKYGIKYFYEEKLETIGKSRNNAISQCSNDIIVFMDDDDYYEASSVKKRIAPLYYNESANIVSCTILGCFAINKYHSYIEPPDLFGLASKKFRVGSMAFRREVFDFDYVLGKSTEASKTSRICDDKSIHEMSSIISANIHNIIELNWEGIIISLTHSKNTTHRKVDERETNNSLFGLGGKMFKFITELDKTDEELKEEQERKKKAYEDMLMKQKKAEFNEQKEKEQEAREN